MHPLTEKIAFVTGAAQGIGHGIALELAKAGADVIVADIQESGVTASAAEISALGRRALPLCFDLTDADSVVAAAGTAVARFGRIDILVNNAGVVQKRAGLETSTEDFDLCQTVNVNTVWSMSQAVIPHFRSRRSGKIVNIASVAGRRGWMETPAYAASKAAILNLTQSLALALAPDNINVNAICPGLIDTAMMTEIRTALGNREGDEAFKSAIVSNIPLRRQTTPEDVGRAVVFFASDDARNITGQALNVDGGTQMN